ncbi:MAG: DUF433 domain-containing protein [Rhodobacteraceae bacterium]|nr:MAG: DUF433 domain-containing protein [Paracoccaceae bacterium]
MSVKTQILGSGIYTAREAARLAHTNTVSVLRWTRGSGPTAPLWNSYYSELDDSREISFLDLMEVRVVVAFRNKGLSLQSIRFAIELAQKKFNIDRPLSSATFNTDGTEIFMEALEYETGLFSMDKRSAGQKVFKEVIGQSLLDLEYEGIRPVRWKPRKNKHVVIDPTRAFGDPILSEYGVSTKTLADEYKLFSDYKYLSNIYEIPIKQIKDAINFEERLDG